MSGIFTTLAPALTASSAMHPSTSQGCRQQGDWPHMGTQDPDQAFLDAYRYQLATMVYGAGVAHYHRLPAMRSLFKPLIRNLILKMLRPEVWSYWYLTSQSGNRLDPDLKELRKPWADPIVRENIILYAMLFEDDEFERPNCLTFKWDPLFWGMGPETFSYDNQSLQDAILKEMERGDWAGVCFSGRYYLVSGEFIPKGTTTQNYEVMSRANAFMNTWNSAFVRASHDKQAQGFLTNADGNIELHHPAIGAEIRRLVAEEDADANSKETIQRARQTYLSAPPRGFRYTQPTLELDALLSYADSRFHPTWENGGLYYPRQDQVTNEIGEWTIVDPFSGNAAIGYARLNVEDGQKKMWENPWTRKVLSERPWVDGLDLS
ncbi:hypothetical protein AJ80_00288 [Polytolypa hystricis UAMH7299]|uniref:Linalool dehydratase/isomerase domain-containing protein n=1 Tax=Polytolypa hystricis (strain UAMH7299) TaxID=1447883 RepID=A0A2B7Z469_POLH7|nr:hypothetical protein AJ80_00288 [Polytolypa hystricis UAMH7299]